jgi:Periplasmic binding protein
MTQAVIRSHGRSGRVRRLVAAVCVLGLGLAACGNSGDDDDEGATGTTAGDDNSGDGAASGDRDTFVEISGVPGVTDDEIQYAVIGTRANNPLGTCILDCYLDGIKAYFAFRNDEGGIYGRQLTVADELDDELAQNQTRALDVISANDVFGDFNATLAATGWGDLDEAGVPTYVWGIHGAEMANRDHIFGHIQGPCSDCTGRVVPYAAEQAGATKVAALGYGVSETSRLCAQGTAKSVEMYAEDTGAELAYEKDDLAFGLTNGIAPEVTEMKGAGVDFIATCFDINAMKTLGQELHRQGMDDVTMYHPNTYNQQFVADNADLFDGDIVTTQFVPFEADVADTQQAEFQQWMDETGADVSELAMIGWINADLAFQGLLAAGPEFDRESVVDATNQMTDYDAGGLINPIDWTRQHAPVVDGDPSTDYAEECAPLVRVVDGAFETVAPADKPWLCWSNDNQDWSDPTPTSFN